MPYPEHGTLPENPEYRVLHAGASATRKVIVNRQTALVLFFAVLFASLAIVASAVVEPVSPDEAAAWLRYTVPLPKTITIGSAVTVAPAQIAIVPAASTDIVALQASKELRETLHLAENAPNPPSPAFTITLVLGGEESQPLEALKNSEQASKITVEPGDAGLRIIALQPRGLYYGAKTLQQLIAPYASETAARIPLIEMTDWPDITDRGLWGSDHFAWLRWLADRKMNIGEQISARSVSSDGAGHSSLKEGREPMVTEGPYYGLKPVPVVLHLEQVWASGLFTYYPQLIGVGGQYGAICYSQPEFINVLADWIVELRSLPFVEEVDVWMTENLHGAGGCQCAQCSQWNRDVLEANKIVAAWQQAKQRMGVPIGLRILTSEETEASNGAVFASLPPEVKVWYYHSLYTYTSGRTGIVSRDTANYAASGRYAGVCPSLASIGAPQPFQSAEFAKYRMTEFVEKGMSGYIGYATPAPLVKFVGYNVEAAAEFSWNLNGRSTREFALSHAVRKGLPDPEMFAEWAEAVGKLEFDLNGSEWPTCDGRYFPGYVADKLRTGKLPALGEAYPGFRGPWGEFKSVAQLEGGVVLAAKALRLAEQMGSDEYFYESVYIDGLVNSLRALYKLKGLVVNGTVSAANRETARYWFGVYINGLKQSIAAVQNWSLAVNGESGSVSNVVAKMQRCIYGEDGTANPGMLRVASDCGCTPNLAYNPIPAISIPDARRLGPGAIVRLYGDLVSGANGATCFVQQADRAAGIRVSSPAAIPAPGPVALIGMVSLSNGELVVNADILQAAGAAHSAVPLRLKTCALGGGAAGQQPAVMEMLPGAAEPVAATGLNTMGLFARIAGWVRYVGSDFFYIDDGAGCNDGSGHIGVRVVCADPAAPKPALGTLVRADGMVSTHHERSHNWRALYISDASAVVKLADPEAPPNTPPHIDIQPVSQSVCPGGTAAFTISAGGSTPLSFRWRKGTSELEDGDRISGAATDRLTISGVSAADAATDYNCVVTNDFGSRTSVNVSLTVSTGPPPPAALSALTTTSAITWRWSASDGADGYRLFMAPSGGTQIGGDLTETSHTETGFDPGTSAARYVEAFNSCGVSTRTQLTATTVPRYCVENGDFEGGFTAGVGNHWTRIGSLGTFSQDTSIRYEGTSSQRVLDPIAGDQFSSWIYQKLNVQPGRNYTASMWHRREVTSGAVVQLGVSLTGALTPDIASDGIGSAGEWRNKGISFTAGATGKMTVMLRVGSNGGDTTARIDLVRVRPQAPTSTGGSTTIAPGGSATITANGGFGGAAGELHWYTGPNGTGTHAGTGLSLVVSPAATTSYYPRWESNGPCPSDDGAAVKVTVSG